MIMAAAEPKLELPDVGFVPGEWQLGWALLTALLCAACLSMHVHAAAFLPLCHVQGTLNDGQGVTGLLLVLSIHQQPLSTVMVPAAHRCNPPGG